MLPSDEVGILTDEAASLLLPILQANLRLTATAGGWPSAIAQALTVEYADGVISATYPQSMETEVHNLEYGAEGVPPRPVLRSFSYRCDSVLKQVLSNQIVDTLVSMEEVF